VSFDIDANGILNVSAKDLGTGKEQKITITASSGLSKEEIERMRKDAELHATEDAKRREEVETRNQAENLCYQVEKLLKENADKIPADKKAPVEKAAADLKEALKGGSADEIKAKQEALNQAMSAVTEGMYAQQGAQPDAGGFGGAAGGATTEDSSASSAKTAGDDGVIDADYTMMDDNKKR